jgi:predicted dienelactone hydrolase
MNFPTRLFTGILALMPVPALKAQETVPLRRSDGQQLQVKAYTPKHAGCRGIALVSPGAGGTEHGYTHLGQALSNQGYLAIVMGHRESGPSALREHVHSHTLREGVARLITDPAAYQGRLLDIAAAQTWGKERCDSSQAILVGHSMGAATVMIEAGARNKLGLPGATSKNPFCRSRAHLITNWAGPPGRAALLRMPTCLPDANGWRSSRAHHT